jgi:hypothetical protein
VPGLYGSGTMHFYLSADPRRWFGQKHLEHCSSKYPRQRRGLYFKSRSKRLFGLLTRPQ